MKYFKAEHVHYKCILQHNLMAIHNHLTFWWNSYNLIHTFLLTSHWRLVLGVVLVEGLHVHFILSFHRNNIVQIYMKWPSLKIVTFSYEIGWYIIKYYTWHSDLEISKLSYIFRTFRIKNTYIQSVWKLNWIY